MAGLGLSAAVDGFIDAKRQRKADERREVEDAWVQELRGRQREQWAHEDRIRNARNEANAAGAAVLAGFEREATTSLGGPTEPAAPPAAAMQAPQAPDPAAAAMPQGLGSAIAPQQAAAAPRQPYRPRPEQLIKAYETRGQALAKAGDFEGFTENFAKMAPLRAQMRAGVIDDAMLAYKTDGDLGRLVKTVYGTVEDGRQIVDVVKAPAQPSGDGSTAAEAAYTLKFSDGAVSQPITASQALEIVQRVRSDPAKVAEAEFKHALAVAEQRVKHGNAIAEIRERGTEARKTLGDRIEGTLDAIDRRGEHQLEAIDRRGDVQRDVARIRVSGQMSVTQLRANLRGAGGSGSGGSSGGGNKVQSRFTDSDGNVVLVMRDGTHQALVGDDGRPVKSLDYQKLIGSVARDVGKTEITNTPQQNRDAAKKMLGSDKPAAGGRDYSGLWRPSDTKAAEDPKKKDYSSLWR